MQLVESSPIVIRLASFRDQKEIFQLEKLALQNLCQNNYDVAEIEVLTSKISQLHFNDQVTFVAEQEQKIIGFASFLSYRKLLRTLYVKPNFMDGEIEVKLLNALEQEARRKKIDILKVTSSLAERAFYHSRGYQEIAVCPLAKMDILVPGIAMQKQLMPTQQYNILVKVLSQITLSTFVNVFFLLLII